VGNDELGRYATSGFGDPTVNDITDPAVLNGL
jgi:hypothetical protein